MIDIWCCSYQEIEECFVALIGKVTIGILLANFIGDYLMTVLDPREGVRPVQDLRAFLIGGRAGPGARARAARAKTEPGQ